jgi:hypothetical protein
MRESQFFRYLTESALSSTLYLYSVEERGREKGQENMPVSRFSMVRKSIMEVPSESNKGVRLDLKSGFEC